MALRTPTLVRLKPHGTRDGHEEEKIVKLCPSPPLWTHLHSPAPASGAGVRAVQVSCLNKKGLSFLDSPVREGSERALLAFVRFAYQHCYQTYN